MDVNYFFPANLLKTGEESNGKIPISIIPNSPVPDRVNDKILLKAFDQDCISDYINNSGIIDYDHQSMLAKSDFDRVKAIIGEAEELYIDETKQVPVCNGFLFKGNQYVDEAILPALKSGSKIYGASVGGKILRKSTEIDPKTKKEMNVISRISLNHIAITPRAKAVNTKTLVELRKSLNEEIVTFDNFEDFAKSFSDLRKTLMAGCSTDISGMSGGQVLQSQSLEGVNYAKIRYSMPFLLDKVFEGRFGNTKEYLEYLISKGFSVGEAFETIKLLAKNGAKIVRLTF